MNHASVLWTHIYQRLFCRKLYLHVDFANETKFSVRASAVHSFIQQPLMCPAEQGVGLTSRLEPGGWGETDRQMNSYTVGQVQHYLFKTLLFSVLFLNKNFLQNSCWDGTVDKHKRPTFVFT